MPRITRKHLTEIMIDRAKPGKKDGYLWDAKSHGLGVKITPSGSKIYVHVHKMAGWKQPKRKRFAAFREISLSDARENVNEWNAQIVRGINPHEATANKSVAEVAKDYIRAREDGKTHEGIPSKKHLDNCKSWLRKHIEQHSIGRKSIQGYELKDVSAFMKDKSHIQSTANHIRSFMISVEKYAILNGMRDEKMRSWENAPTFKFEPNRERFVIPDDTSTHDEREIFLSYMEEAMHQIILDKKGAPIHPSFIGIMLVMYFTGARVSELQQCKLSELDLQSCQIIKVEHKTVKKTGKKKIIHLPQIAIDVIHWVLKNAPRQKGNQYLFPGNQGRSYYSHYRRQWNVLRERTGIKVSPSLGMRREYARVGRELDDGRDVSRVQQILSHSNKEMTEVYAGTDSIAEAKKNKELNKDAQLMQQHLMKKAINVTKFKHGEEN